jgi:hypothetical protein
VEEAEDNSMAKTSVNARNFVTVNRNVEVK